MILSFDLFPRRIVTSGENKVKHDFRRSVDFFRDAGDGRKNHG